MRHRRGGLLAGHRRSSSTSATAIRAHPVLIFGSDLSEKAIETARAGLYPDAAVHGLGEDRLKRFFVRTERGWRVSPAVRELCVFVRHDVARDPPFSRLDLVSCRNVLIYFGQPLQRRVLAAAHYCLNQPGYLLLGRSESASSVPRWFAPAEQGRPALPRRPGPSTYRLAPRAGALALRDATIRRGRPAGEGRRRPGPPAPTRGPGALRPTWRGRQRTPGGGPVPRSTPAPTSSHRRASPRASSSRWRAPASPGRCGSRSRRRAGRPLRCTRIGIAHRRGPAAAGPATSSCSR